MNLYDYVSSSIKTAIADVAELASADLSNVSVEVPKTREFGDFSTNAAMVLTKQLGLSPRAIAELIVPALKTLPFAESVSIAGVGFINIKLKDSFILECANTPTKGVVSHPRRGGVACKASRGGASSESKSNNKKIKNINQKKPPLVADDTATLPPYGGETRLPLTIDIDYGGYNIGKDLHVGHYRTTVVGDTYHRIAKYLGHRTKSYNHMGDWGRPMGLIIAWIMEFGMPDTAVELNKIYPASTARAKDDEKWMDRARKITAELQSGNAEYKKIYDDFVRISMAQMDAVLARLNIMPFDMNMGEYLLSPYMPIAGRVLEDHGLLARDDGALVVKVARDDDAAPMPPLMWQTSAGASTYGTADVTAIYYRNMTDQPDVISYFTDSRQNLHFNQVFRVAKLAELTDAQLFHTGFGTITGADGKPFKTRDGNVPSMDGLMDLVVDAARARVAESGKNLPDDTIHMIALAALKFNDLMHDMHADYVFDPDLVTQFEGRTGPYILYTAVRLNSVLKKSPVVVLSSPRRRGRQSPVKSLSGEERELLLTVLDFDRALRRAFDMRATDVLANYTYDLCQAANVFYHNCPILRPDIDDATRAHRLAILERALDTLSTAIDLMGLKVPDEM